MADEPAILDVSVAETGESAAVTAAAGQCGLHAHRRAGQAGRNPGTRLLGPDTLVRIAAFVDANLDGDLTIETLSAIAGMSRHHFSRRFKLASGASPHAFIVARRMARARTLFADTRLSLETIIAQVGFSNANHFRRQFRRHFGVNPSEIRGSLRG